MTAIEAQVVVVGAGPVGLALCAGLAHHGIDGVVLVDPASGGHRQSRAFGVWARTLETLRDWGLFDDLAARGSFLRTLEPVDGRTGRRLFTFDFAALEPLSPTAGVLIAPQWLTEDVLQRHIAESGVRRVIATAETVDQADDTATVTARAADGGTLRIRGRYVVGCDGAHSTVRRALGLTLAGRTYPTRMVLADVRLAADDSDLSSMRFAARYPGFLAGIRFGHREWRVMATIGSPAQARTQEWPVRLRALFGARTADIVWSSEFALYRRAVANFRRGRVALAGDAAHLISPAGGQGMNSGIQDAENLAWKLAACVAGGDEERLLDSYDRERRGLVAGPVSRTAEWTQHVEFGLPNTIKMALLSALDLAARVPRCAAVMAGKVSMLGHRYPDSPLLHGSTGRPHRLVGRRLPDPVLADGTRLSDHLRGRAALVAIASEAPRVALPSYPLPDPPRSWHVPNGAALLVRPDRHVGAVLPHCDETTVSTAARRALGRPLPITSPRSASAALFGETP